ncbi:dienelactone hydrolase family protein [Sinomonas sp. ASV486]|uniref:alpha/beta hydrolase n=1 Tax=Sinomonas sp. ASV486 TaxID=3051170 RepID=UPI0027DB7E75|nr:dienelactone hydrolase family protein [Sinomonas sp. ASV486]MDQ4490430.1 dienelactone hydrolase family protein [Sinomonas sp. ASV486]
MTDATADARRANFPAHYPAHVALWSRPEGERAGSPLIVLFHGYGSNEADLMGLAGYLPEEFTVVSLRAPQTLAPGAYQWFPLMAAQDFTMDSVEAATEYVLAWLDGVREQHTSVTLLGFSMGVAMATSLVRRRPDDFAAVVGLSGFAIDPAAAGEKDYEYFRDTELDGTVPMFWGRDQADPVITADKVEYTMGWVRSHVALTKVTYPGSGHGISGPELAHVKEFLELSVLKG